MAGINTNKKETLKSALEQEEMKKKLEKKFVQDLKTFYEQLCKDFEILYSSTGKILTLNESYEEELSSLLKKNYRKVSGEFSDITQDLINDSIDLELYKPINEELSVLNNDINKAIATYLLLRAKYITPKITNTTQEELIRKTQNFIIKKASEGIAVKQAEIASAVSKEMLDWSERHSKIISTTEVETIAEKSKQIENSLIKGNITSKVNDIKQTGKCSIKPYAEMTKDEIKDELEVVKIAKKVDIQKGSRKTWITAGDERVRESHVVLDSKSLNQDELFTTGIGSKMMYSGDMDNGAPLKDVINCRCSTVYKFNSDIITIYRNMYYRRK